VAPLSAGRHPGLVAREATALDLLSGGRALVVLEDDDAERLAEALAVVRALFAEEAPSFGGRHFTLAGAVNRPGPTGPEGPPVVLVPGPGTAGPWAAAAGAVAVGDLEALSAWRAVAPDGVLLWRATVGPEPAAAAAATAAARAAGADGALVSLGPVLPDAATVAALGAALGAAA
jgi:alkanesulfonate monooxygenase SsuD/methylene tetrahydromethanopterin reductase-like flavin-dependent oxidoreductase (luciferase family)